MGAEWSMHVSLVLSDGMRAPRLFSVMPRSMCCARNIALIYRNIDQYTGPGPQNVVISPSAVTRPMARTHKNRFNSLGILVCASADVGLFCQTISQKRTHTQTHCAHTVRHR